eukprot:GHVR01066204.1.p1 GENE.GHVR01066204.1~~GHVR01066204.1.p1  ORF type:complete len:193 (+),score=5.48 GHVR01066204.1:83-661(+)
MKIAVGVLAIVLLFSYNVQCRYVSENEDESKPQSDTDTENDNALADLLRTYGDKGKNQPAEKDDIKARDMLEQDERALAQPDKRDNELTGIKNQGESSTLRERRARRNRYCGKVYNHAKRIRESVNVYANIDMASIGWWNNKISSITVAYKCKIYAYEHTYYGGHVNIYYSSTNWVGSWWNDRISSYKCRCR